MSGGSPSAPTIDPPTTTTTDLLADGAMPGRPLQESATGVPISSEWSPEADATLGLEQSAQPADEAALQSKRKVADWQRHTDQGQHPPPSTPNGSVGHSQGPLPPANGVSVSASNGVATQSSSPQSTAENSPRAFPTPPDLRLTDQSRRLAALRMSGGRSLAQEALAAALAECERTLAAAHVREAELQRETRVLAARLAHLRMAHEAQAGKLAEAAGRAVAARAEVVAENARLASALAQAQHHHAAIAQQLLPMLARHGLTPPPSDPHALCTAVTALVDRLATEVNLLQKVVAGGGPVMEQRLTAAVQETPRWPAPASLSLPAPPATAPATTTIAAAAAPVDTRGSPDSSLSLATGIGPTPVPVPVPVAVPLFPGGAWSPLPPGAAPPPPSSSDAAAPAPPLDAPPPPPAPWPMNATTGLERPMSVRFRPTPDTTTVSAMDATAAAAAAGRSMARRSPSWQGTDARAGGASLRDSQRNLLDSVASQHTRGLAASQDPSTWQMSSLAEVPPSDAPLDAAAPSGEQDTEPLPGIVNLTVAGEACLGGKLTACGHSVFGSSLCYFQWVRHKPDNSAYLIEGAKQPEYLVSADDACCQITVECLPVDNRGRKGELVKAAANNGEPIPLDEVTTNLLTGYAASGKARFRVLDAHNAVEHELVIDRRSFTIKRGSHVVIKEPYGGEVAAEIAVNEASIVLIHISGGRRMDLDCIDNRSRDLAVLTLRHFVETHAQYMDDRTRRRSFFSRR